MTSARRRLKVAITCALAASLAGCDLAPPYNPPPAPLPAAYQPAPGWVEANPQTPVGGEAWWIAYGNATLDALEPRHLRSSRR